MTEIYLHRQSIITQLLEIQRYCPITGKRVNASFAAHEWLIPRNCGLPKRDQLKIYHLYNMVLLDTPTHDAGLNCCQRLRIARFKIAWHGHDAIQAWLESLELRTYRDLDSIVSAWQSRCQPG